MHVRRVAVLGGALGGLLALVAVAPAVGRPVSAPTGPAARSAPGAASTVSVVLKEWSIQSSARSIPAGQVTFVVRNGGKLTHEFTIIRSDKPLVIKGAKASEVGRKGKISPFAPGTTKRLTLTLAPGKYMLICNMPGHYKAGQRLAFTVAPAAVAPPATTDVNVSLFEMGFKLSTTTVPHGTVNFHLKNDGKLPHDFSFGSKGGGSPMVQAGETVTFTAKFAAPGKYTFICTVEGHQEAGMIGVLTVT